MIDRQPPPLPSGYEADGQAIYFTGNNGKISGIERDSNSAKARSKTFPGIAKAMSEQWGETEEAQI